MIYVGKNMQTSLRIPTSSKDQRCLWQAWKAPPAVDWPGMVADAMCRKDMTQMKSHLRATQATNTSAQLSYAPEPEWMSGWASSIFIEAFRKSSSGSLSLEKEAVWRRRPTSRNRSIQPGAPTLEQLKALSGSLGISPAKGRWQVHCVGWPCT